jgi:hypothetical protein
MSEDGKVINFKTAAPSARMKQFDAADKRPSCPHHHIEIWHKEPIIECQDCGAVVDPYYWIRQRCEDWRQMEDAVQWRINAAKRELEELRVAVRLVRKEYKDEAEKRQAERQLMVMPPQRSF